MGVFLVLCSCAPAQNAGRAPREPRPDSESVIDLSRVREVKREHERRLLDIPGVVGTGISQDAEGRWVIEVYVARLDDSLREKLPRELEGIPVRLVETGPFKARD